MLSGSSLESWCGLVSYTCQLMLSEMRVITQSAFPGHASPGIFSMSGRVLLEVGHSCALCLIIPVS